MNYLSPIYKFRYDWMDLNYFNWNYLSNNPNAFNNLLISNIDYINWFHLSSNKNPEAIELLKLN